MLISVKSTSVLNSVSDIFYEDTTSSISRLENIEAGIIWETEHIFRHKKNLLNNGRNWTIVDNLVVHDEIKYGGPNSNYYIENYKQSLINLAKAGIEVVCYNFMPVFYKVRTHFISSFSDPYAFSMFDPVAFTVFDMYILKRPDAEKCYTEYEKHKALLFKRRLGEQELFQLKVNVLSSVQGMHSANLQYVLQQTENYKSVSNEELRCNFMSFKNRIEAVAKALNLTLHFNTDNPVSNLLNLPGL